MGIKHIKQLHFDISLKSKLLININTHAMSKIWNIGLLGCGKVARMHAAAIGELSNARLAGVWSRTRSSADAFADAFGTTSHATPGELVTGAGIDLAIICTPHQIGRASCRERVYSNV